MRLLTICLLILSLTNPISGYSQEKAIAGLGDFVKYDRTYATPELRKKPGISVGYNMVFHVPIQDHFQEDNFSPNNGFHIAYNHMYSRRGGLRRRVGPQVFRERFQFGFGGTFNLDFNNSGEKFGSISAYFFRPIIRINLGLIKFSFINEYGLGIAWRPESYAANGKKIAPIIKLEPFRFQLFSLPIYFTSTTLYSIRNDVFGKSALNVSFLLGARMYFYDYSEKKG